MKRLKVRLGAHCLRFYERDGWTKEKAVALLKDILSFDQGEPYAYFVPAAHITVDTKKLLEIADVVDKGKILEPKDFEFYL